MSFNIFQNQTYNKIFKYLIIAYIIFGALMIYRSSFIGVDGHRYFSLFDDAMISMRYADNLAHGNGLVWNIGQRVEGFTNPLMVFVMAGFIKILGKNLAVLGIQMLGLFLLLCNLWLVLKIAIRLLKLTIGDSDFLLFVTLLLTMFWYPVFYWSIFGMETGLLTTLVLWVCYEAIYERPNLLLNWRFAVVISLIYLARPDSLMFMLIFFAFRAITKIRSWKTLLWFCLEALIAFFPVALYQIFRMQYYHQIFPNTYILKATGMDSLDRIKNGVAYFSPFLERIQLFIWAVALSICVILFDSVKSFKKRIYDLLIGEYSYPLLFLVLFLVFAVYQISVGGDPWPPFWRMTVPYTILFFISFAVFVGVLKKSFNIQEDKFNAVVALIVLSLLIFIPYDYHFDFFRLQPYQTLNNQANLNQALLINKLTDKKASVASFWAGTIPYYTDRYSIDPLGKMDSYIANLPPDLDGPFHNRGMTSIPGHNKYDLNYSFKQLMPDVIVYMPADGGYCRWGKQNLEDWCKANYDLVDQQGVKLLLKKNSDKIFWEKIK